ncbi:MAG: octanoyltransferase [Candidatus Hydrogenedentota bacterium]
MITPSSRKLEVIRLEGLVPYPKAYELQVARRKAVERGEVGNALFLLEHEPVITLGRNFQTQNLLFDRETLQRQGIAVVEVDRGGDATYHGPGQLVAYPILNLRYWRQSIRWYLRELEQVLIDQLGDYGLPGERLEGLTGVWVGGAKVAAIGIGIRNWVTYHGIALNVKPNLEHFSFIIPCGIANKPVTSLERMISPTISMEQCVLDFQACFVNRFGV